MKTVYLVKWEKDSSSTEVSAWDPGSLKVSFYLFHNSFLQELLCHCVGLNFPVYAHGFLFRSPPFLIVTQPGSTSERVWILVWAHRISTKPIEKFAFPAFKVLFFSSLHPTERNSSSLEVKKLSDFSLLMVLHYSCAAESSYCTQCFVEIWEHIAWGNLSGCSISIRHTQSQYHQGLDNEEKFCLRCTVVKIENTSNKNIWNWNLSGISQLTKSARIFPR